MPTVSETTDPDIELWCKAMEVGLYRSIATGRWVSCQTKYTCRIKKADGPTIRDWLVGLYALSRSRWIANVIFYSSQCSCIFVNRSISIIGGRLAAASDRRSHQNGDKFASSSHLARTLDSQMSGCRTKPRRNISPLTQCTCTKKLVKNDLVHYYQRRSMILAAVGRSRTSLLRDFVHC